MKEMEDLWTGLGVAAVILAFFLGIGGCIHLAGHDAFPAPPTIEQKGQKNE